MNFDRIFALLAEHRVAYLLIGGVNFMLRHKPLLTYDEDMLRCQMALKAGDRKPDRIAVLEATLHGGKS